MPLDQCFSELNCSRSASFSKVKEQYYTLSKLYHPDLNKEKDSVQKFQRINEAFQTIKNDFDLKKEMGGNYQANDSQNYTKNS